MKKHTAKFTAELFVPLAAFAIAVISIFTDTKWFASNQLSAFGAVLIAFSCLTLVAGIWLAFLNRRQLAQESQDREEIEKLAHQLIHDYMWKMIWPLKYAVTELHHHYAPENIRNLPYGKIDKASDFFKEEAIARLKVINLYASFSSHDKKATKFEQLKDDWTWGGAIEYNAKKWSGSLSRLLPIYVTYLKPQLVRDLTILLHSDYMDRLRRCRELMEINWAHNTDRELHFFDIPMGLHGEAEVFFGLFDLIAKQLQLNGESSLMHSAYARTIWLTSHSTRTR